MLLLLHHISDQISRDLFIVRLDLYRKEPFFLPAVHSQYSVSGGFFYRFFKVIVHLIDRFLSMLFSSGQNPSMFFIGSSDPFTVFGIIRDHLRENIFGSLEGIFRCLCSFFRINKLFSLSGRIVRSL